MDVDCCYSHGDHSAVAGDGGVVWGGQGESLILGTRRVKWHWEYFSSARTSAASRLARTPQAMQILPSSEVGDRFLR